MNAAILTDFVQGILTIVLSFLILPFALDAVGGMTGLREQLADAAMFRVVAPEGSEITVFYVVIISINALIGIVTQPETMAMGGAGRTEMEGRVGFTVGSLAKRVCAVAWVFTGMCAIAIYMGKDIEPDQVYGMMAHDLLPDIAPGLVGLFIASMLAAVMSSCDAKMVLSAGLFTENLYRSFISPGRSDQHYTVAGRVCSAVVVLVSILFAFELESVIKGLEVFWMVSAMMGIPFWVGLFWRRATVAGAWAGTLSSFYLVTGFVVCVVVSLLTCPVPKARLDRFYQCMRTAVVTREPETDAFTLPAGLQPAPRNVLIQHPDFEIPKPMTVSVVGFAATWAAVGLLVAAFYGILTR